MNSLETLSAPGQAALRQLVEAYRERCLWSFRPDFYPQSHEEARIVLEAIQRYGDREGFIRSAEIRTWLSPNSSAPSASS